MTLFADDHIRLRAMLIGCVMLALLTLPFMGVLHCQIMHDRHEPASPSLADACCVYLCFTALVGMTNLARHRLMVARAALNVQPVRLTGHLTRWVPPPRPIGSLA